MKKDYKIFVTNPGSTSTKIALFENDNKVFQTNVDHPVEELNKCEKISDQLPLRLAAIKEALAEAGVSLEGIDAVATRAGSLAGMVGGVYRVNQQALDDSFYCKFRKHASSLGPTMAKMITEEYGGEMFFINTPDVDELDELERVCGFHEFARMSGAHPLNQKENCIRYAKSQGKRYEDMTFIVCNMGGGCSVGAHKDGKMFSCNDAFNGDGPMAPTRSGWLPATQLVKMCYSGNYTEEEIIARITRSGGFADHLGTSDAREIVARIKDGDKYAELIYNAFIYQVAKAVGGCAVALQGKVDVIILTGGMAYDEYLVEHMKPYIDWIAPVYVNGGEVEMEGLAAGVIRALEGEEEIKEYTGIPVWSGFESAPEFDTSKDDTKYY